MLHLQAALHFLVKVLVCEVGAGHKFISAGLGEEGGAGRRIAQISFLNPQVCSQ